MRQIHPRSRSAFGQISCQPSRRNGPAPVVKFVKQFSLDSIPCRFTASLEDSNVIIFGERGIRNMNSQIMSAGFLAILLGSCGIARCQQEPAGEGRPITPAGALVIDAATHLPAVGAMPMAMLGSPDALGHGGKGRYLLVVNSGFGVQFSEETNRAQQSIAVIDLNAAPEPLVIQNVYFPSPQSANVGLAFSPAAGADGNFEMYVSGCSGTGAAGIAWAGYESRSALFRTEQ